MKKLIIALLLIASISGYAQITIEHTYPHSAYDLNLVKLSSSGYKYWTADTNTITILNLNHTIFRTISIPSLSNTTGFHIWYLSEELFNTNPSDIEYFLEFQYSGSSVGHSRIFDEAGNLLFSSDSTSIVQGTYYGNESAITYTPSGWKMILTQFPYGTNSYIYSLPGFLPCHDCTNGVTTSMVTDNNNLKSSNISNYPNPTSEQTTIEYGLPQGTTSADLVFYNITGQEIKRFKVSDAFHDIIISTTDLDAGTYYYQLQTTSGFKAGKKMIVIK